MAYEDIPPPIPGEDSVEVYAAGDSWVVRIVHGGIVLREVFDTEAEALTYAESQRHSSNPGS